MTNFKKETVIRAFDFKPMADRPDCFIEGIVLETGMIKHPNFGCDWFEGYTILITETSREDDPRIGDRAYVPFEMDFMDFDGRITEV